MDMIKSNHPIQIPSSFDSEKFQLQQLLLSLLEQWDVNSGSFLDDFLNPLMVKIYIEDYKPEMNRTAKYDHASRFLGISGLNSKTSTLHKLYLKVKTES
jgi:hypothetical protein